MARLYANENFPFLAVVELRRLGHDVVTVHETGKADRSTPDIEVLDFAITEKRAVVTLNRKHFIALHSQRPDHFGMVVCTVDANFARQAQRIHQALAAYPDLSGKVIRVNRPDR